MPHAPRRAPATLAIGAVVVLASVAVLELAMGRSWLGPDGRFGWIELDVWSAAQSQRVADWYSVSHVVHGLLFYGLLSLVAGRRPMVERFLLALLLEAGWEVLENSPLIIDRYRETTIAVGYVGDSVLNSLSDVLMMAAGFGLAARLPVAASVAVVAGAELGMLLAIRDNLTLNVVMLVYPIEAIREWQMAAAPPGVVAR